MESYRVFDKYYRRYDEWYLIHDNIRRLENKCIRTLTPYGRILDIGVGTAALLEGVRGVIVGIDPAEKPLAIASKRGVLPVNGFGEELPFIDEYFDTVLIVVTICFLQDPLRVLHEAWRVLRRGGFLITCFVPRSSCWGRHYVFLRDSGRSVFYRYARFYDANEVLYMLSIAGFHVRDYCSILKTPPYQPVGVENPVIGLHPYAGFVCVRAVKY